MSKSLTDFEIILLIPEHSLYAELLKEQGDDLEVTFCCDDGNQKCSSWILEFSEFFSKKIVGFKSLNNELIFDYKLFSKETVKLFLDLIHGLAIVNLKRSDVLQLIKFLTFEGKLGSFEKGITNFQ